MCLSRLKESKVLLSTPLKAVLLLGLFLSVIAMAYSGILHKALHANAANPDHHCAVTLLASGQIDAPAGIPPVVPLKIAPVCFLLPELPIPTGVSFNLPQGRGPPALL